MIKAALVDPPEPDWVINPLPLLGTAILKTLFRSYIPYKKKNFMSISYL